MDIDTLRGWSAETAPAEVIPRGGAVVGLHTLNGIGIAPDVILSFKKLPVLIDVPLLYDTIGIIEVIVDILIVIVIITSECHLRQPTVVVILPEIGGVKEHRGTGVLCAGVLCAFNGPSDRLCCLVNVVSEKGCKTLQHYNITGGCITVYEGMTGYGEGIFIKILYATPSPQTPFSGPFCNVVML